VGVRPKLTKNEGAILAGLALAAYYFPQTDPDGNLVSSFAHA
jgi:hypothetical protein